MSLQFKAFLGFIVILLAFSDIFGLQDGDSDINWYEGFFLENKRESAEKALARYTTKLNEASETGDIVGKIKSLKEIGLTHLTKSTDYELAMNYFIKALALEDSLAIKDKQVFTHLAIAKVFEKVGDYQRSAQSLEQALKINEQFQDTSILVLILNELGKVHAAMGNLDQALENYQHVLKYKDQMGQPKVEAEALFNLGNLYKMQGNYPASLQKHKLALALRRSIKDKTNEALSLNDIGELYRFMKNDERALANHVAALEIRQALGDKKGIAESYNNIGVLYYQQKNTQRSIANLELALKAGRESHAQNEMRKSFEYLTLCYKALGDYKTALEYKENYQQINEFIQNEINEHKLVEAQNRYTISKKESQIDKLEIDRIQKEKEISEQKKFRNVLFIIIGLILIIVVLILYLYLLNQRSNKVLKAANDKVHQQNVELQNLNATKDKFFSIISHDLKGPLNSLTSFSGLLINHTESLSKEEIQILAIDLDKSIKNLFSLLENLLEWSRSQTGNIEFTPEAFDLALLLDENKELLKAQAQNKKIDLINECTGEVPVNAHKQSINTVVRNLISNAIKFTPEGGTITLGVQHNKNNVIVSIADNGVGMSKEIVGKLFRIDTKLTTKGTANEKGTGLGLILCKDFIEKNGGQILVESELGKGSVFYFTLPISQ